MSKRYQTIVIVEPILRGSRLQITANLIQSVLSQKPNYKIIIITRKDWYTPHYKELLNAHQEKIKIVPSEIDLDEKWIKTLNYSEWKNIIESLKATLITVNCSLIILVLSILK